MRKLTAFLTMAVLAAAARAQGPEYFPLKAGRKLHYRATVSQSINMGGQPAGGSSGTSNGVEEVVGPSKALGKEAILVRSVRNDSISGGPMGAVVLSYTNEAYYQATAEGVYLLATFRIPGDTIQEAESTKYEQPLQILKLPADSGAGWRVGTTKLRGALVTTDAKVQGREDVTVPAGTFKNCLKVKQTSSDVGGTMAGGMGGMEFSVTGGELSTTAWYASGIGLVKEQVYTRLALSAPNLPPGAGLDATFEQTRQLVKVEGSRTGKETKTSKKK
jgi:hypothetical protein